MSLLPATLLAVALQASAMAGPTLTDLIETPSVSSPALSGDGRWVAFRRDEASVSSNRHGVSWWVVPADGSKPARRIADGGEALFNDAGVLPSAPPIWSARSDSFYFKALTRQGVQVVRASLDGRTRTVTDSPADIVDFTVDGDGAVVYVAGASRAEILAAEADQRDRGVLVDATVDPAQNLFDAIRINGRPAAQRLAGRWFSRRGLLGNEGIAFWRTNGRRPAAPVTAQIAEASGMVLDTAKKPVFGRPPLVARSETGSVARPGTGADAIVISAPSGSKAVCPTSVCGTNRITQLVWRAGRDELVFITKSDAGGRALQTWRVGEKTSKVLFESNGLLHGGGLVGSPCAIDARLAVCVLASTLTPPHLVSIDLDDGQKHDLTRSQPELGVSHRHLEWRDKAGRRFQGEMIEPLGDAAARPLFITYYSCDGYLRGGVGDEWPLSALARSGISALCISAPPEQPGEQDGNVKANETAVSGIEAAINLLKEQGRIDAARVGVGGVSFGADVSMWAAMRLPQVAAVSIASLQLEPTYWWFNTVRGRDAPELIRQAWGLGSPEDTPERWRLLSPAKNVEKIRVPVLLQLPEQEFRSTMELYARLTQSSVPAELYVFAAEPHILTEPRHRLAAYERNLDWFRFWLKGEEDPSPAKAQQYRRWRDAKQAWQTVSVSSADSRP